jgi:REP element-mobilizing transposase RayT
MKNNLQKHHRHSIRLPGYDYSQPGAYFVTVCTRNKECLLGEIKNGEVVLNEAGKTIQAEWVRTPSIRKGVLLDEFVIMPNHLHGIIVLANCRGVSQYAPTKFRSPSQTVGAIIRGFKSTTTKQINVSRNNPNLLVWQRNYYEHIIRSEKSLEEIRKYIQNKPLNWELDEENPKNIRSNQKRQTNIKTVVGCDKIKL